MKTFEDLKFNPHPTGFENSGHATMSFQNNYGVSVIYGSMFYSTGIGSYEIAILYNDEITYSTPITDDVIGYQSSKEITQIMKKVQELT